MKKCDSFNSEEVLGMDDICSRGYQRAYVAHPQLSPVHEVSCPHSFHMLILLNLLIGFWCDPIESTLVGMKQPVTCS